MDASAMQAINALKSTEQLGTALRDLLGDWARMSPEDAARTQVDQRVLGHRLEELDRELRRMKIDVRKAQAEARRDPLSVPESWQERRQWYGLVRSI